MKSRSGFFLIVLLLSLLKPIFALPEESLLLDTEADSVDREFWDFIVVGVGSAGSILARKLSDRHQSVLAIDVGEFRYNDPIILNPNPLATEAVANQLLLNPRYALTYPVPFGFLQALGYSEGQGSIGGGGAHNFLLAIRGTPDIYDGWAAVTGDPRWLYNSLLPKMKAVEAYTPLVSANPAQRGFTGPIKVTQQPPLSCPFFNSIASITDSVFSNDYNDPTMPTPAANGVVIGANQTFITPNAPQIRSYSATEFLPMAPSPGAVIDANGNGLNGRKLKVLTNARAVKFNVEKGEAVSVEYLRHFAGTERKRIACLSKKGKLILSAGSIQTPKLLLLSGVGPSTELTPLGIDVVVDSPNVGKNLQDQLGPNTVIAGTSSPGEAFLDGNSPVSAITAVPLLPKMRRIQAIVGGGAGVFTALALITNPKSRGSVTIVSSDPLFEPALDFNIFSDGPFTTPGTDANLAVRYLRIICAAAADSGFFMIAPTPAQCRGSDADLFAYASNVANLVLQSHVAGTARMASNISSGVVDGRLKVFGLSNVYIGDNSVAPETENGNTNFMAYYIALELANILGYPTPPAL